MLDVLTLDQLRAFVAVVDSGSFRQSAARLARAQSAVSHAIANLERELGLSLFDRTGHRPRLTPEGEALLANARDILLRVDAMRARARGLGQGVELELSLVVDTLFPLDRVGAALVEVRAAHPSVAFRLDVMPLGGPATALLAQRSTLAIMAGEDFRDPRLSFTALGPIEQVAVVAGSHPLARQPADTPLDVAQLFDHLQIVLADPTPLSEGRSFGVLSPQTCRVGSQEAKHAMILAGLGWGRLPGWLVARDLQEGRLHRLDTSALGRGGQTSYEVYLVHRLDQPLGPAARTFTRALAASAG
jgi:DNA-binding transcriptional LysR family regulator